MTACSSRLFYFTCLLLLISGCAGTGNAPQENGALAEPAVASAPLKEEPEPRVAEVVGGVIFRDPETLRSIRDSAPITLAAGSGNSLQLQVTKSRYRLEVFRNGALIKTYPVALGGSPVGPKTVQGDERTPEGEYLMIPHHPSPSFGSCFYICYPNALDAERGLAEGVVSAPSCRQIMACLEEERKPPHGTPLGGLILLHGIKRRGVKGLTTNNWTLGCIAMENDDLLELLGAYTPDDRPILTILP